MCPLSVALFERFTVCSAKMAEPIDGKASNRLRYTLSVAWWSFTWLVTPTVMMIVDDHAAHQTLAVSIKKPISMARTFCKDDLNEFIEVASSALAGRLFHLFTTLSE